MNRARHARLHLFPMSRRHIPQVLAIENACFPEPWGSRLFEAELVHPLALPLCAVRYPADSVAGYICLWFGPRQVQVQNLAVDPGRRRQGIGRFLLGGGLLEARRKGARVASLEVRPSNEAARALYASLGFVQNGSQAKILQRQRRGRAFIALRPVAQFKLRRREPLYDCRLTAMPKWRLMMCVAV